MLLRNFIPVKSRKGFTLIEVIVALGIIATAMAAVMMTVSANVRNATGLKERTFAHWVAMNKMNELMIQNESEFPPIKKTTGSVLMAEHEWFWEQEVEKTEVDTVRRVYLRVRVNEEDEFPMTTLVGFVSKPN
ncbi:type II secretion system minor pseudopilin GspI [Kaarinaea lacus]